VAIVAGAGIGATRVRGSLVMMAGAASGRPRAGASATIMGARRGLCRRERGRRRCDAALFGARRGAGWTR